MPLSNEPSPNCSFVTLVIEKNAPTLNPFLNLLEKSNVPPLSPAKYFPKDK